MMKNGMKLKQLSEILPYLTNEQIAENLSIGDSIMGQAVYSILLEYLCRYMYVLGDNTEAYVNYLLLRFENWLLYRQHDIEAAVAASVTEFDPSADYRLTESEIKLKNDGDKTVTTKNKYDYESTEGATSGNAPTYSTYTTTYDSTAERLDSKRVDAGSRTTHVIASDDDKNKKTATTTHAATTLTDGETTYTADYIHSLKKLREGNIHRSPAEILKASEDLYMRSVLHYFISEFINRYTFYVGYLGGECL